MANGWEWNVNGHLVMNAVWIGVNLSSCRGAVDPVESHLSRPAEFNLGIWANGSVPSRRTRAAASAHAHRLSGWDAKTSRTTRVFTCPAGAVASRLSRHSNPTCATPDEVAPLAEYRLRWRWHWLRRSFWMSRRPYHFWHDMLPTRHPSALWRSSLSDCGATGSSLSIVGTGRRDCNVTIRSFGNYFHWGRRGIVLGYLDSERYWLFTAKE